jgi:exosortase K
MRTPHPHAFSQATTTRQTVGISGRKAPMHATRILGAVLSLLIMLALKQYYSLASADQLTWILAPTAKLVAWLTPAHPAYEYGVGYVDFVQGIIIAPACAGVNFMIMAFGLAALCCMTGFSRPTTLLICLVASLCSAYGYTILVNTARIGLSMILYRADIYGQWLTEQRLHRLAGIGLYLGALWLWFAGLRSVVGSSGRVITLRCRPSTLNLPDWLPLAWYLLGAVGVPLANLIFRERSSQLGEHCITILVAVGCIQALKKLVQRLLGYGSANAGH